MTTQLAGSAQQQRTSYLECGMKISHLSDLYDLHHGVNDALAPATAQKIENHVSSCSQCRHALAQIARLHNTTHTIFDNDISHLSVNDKDQDSWISRMLNKLSLEVRLGAMVPLEPLKKTNSLHLSEGAIKALIRNYGSSPTACVTSTSILADNGDISEPNTRLTINVNIALTYPCNITQEACLVRNRLWNMLHTTINLHLQAINIHVIDILASELT